MILGDSRSFQGIQPSLINSYFKNKEFSLPILNYSFTIAQMSYGEIWNESIKRKLDTTTRNGLFILTVTPWMLSKRESDDEEKKIFFERDEPPNNMTCVTLNPNFEYFVKNLTYFHFRSVFRKTSEVHKDGWLEESNLTKDQGTLNAWKQNQIKTHLGFSRKWQPSRYRLSELDKLVKYLNNYGSVFIVRMPIDTIIIEIENNYWKGFDDEISELSMNNRAKYINFAKGEEKYRTYDGNHIDKYGGVQFAKDLCDSISSKTSN